MLSGPFFMFACSAGVVGKVFAIADALPSPMLQGFECFARGCSVYLDAALLPGRCVSREVNETRELETGWCSWIERLRLCLGIDNLGESGPIESFH